jgi:uncharacterized protein (DUF362 family)
MSQTTKAAVRVALVKGENRYNNVIASLDLIKKDVFNKVKNKRKVLIKPNMVSTQVQLAATHVDAIRATLDFLSELGVKKFLVGEGPADAPAEEGFKNFGYLTLKNEYDIEFMDLNEDDYVEVNVFDRNLEPLTLKISKTAVMSDFRVSLTPPKTHDTVIATLSLKNMVMGSLIDHDKSRMHQGYQATNLSLFKLAKLVPPHLSVIDGFFGMEGNGPVDGEPVILGVAISSTDFLAADTIAAEVMGFKISQIGYLNYCNQAKVGIGNISDIHVVGDSIERCKKKFKPHFTFEQQLMWKIYKNTTTLKSFP